VSTFNAKYRQNNPLMTCAAAPLAGDSDLAGTVAGKPCCYEGVGVPVAFG